MKSRFLIFTLFLAVMCLGSASNAMAQSVTGTGVFNVGNGGAPATITVSAQQGGSGGIMRFSAPGEHQEGTVRGELTGRPVDICVQDNLALVVAEITHGTVDFAGTEGQFMLLGFRDNGGSGDGCRLYLSVPRQPRSGTRLRLNPNPGGTGRAWRLSH